MAEFESNDVMIKYLEISRKHNLSHVHWPSGHTVTMDDVEQLDRELSGVVDTEIRRVPAEEFP